MFHTPSHIPKNARTTVEMNSNGDRGTPVPDYMDVNVSTKVMKKIQSFIGIVDRVVWRKY